MRYACHSAQRRSFERHEARAGHPLGRRRRRLRAWQLTLVSGENGIALRWSRKNSDVYEFPAYRISAEDDGII